MMRLGFSAAESPGAQIHTRNNGPAFRRTPWAREKVHLHIIPPTRLLKINVRAVTPPYPFCPFIPAEPWEEAKSSEYALGTRSSLPFFDSIVLDNESR